MDFKTAKEIVLALKEIAKNIQGDKSSNTNNDSDNNKDNLQYSVMINPYSDSYGTVYGTIMFKDLIENLTFEEQDVSNLGFIKDNSAELPTYNPLRNLGELENSEVLIKYFNKTVDVINELFNKYDQLEEFYSSTINLAIIICNQSETNNASFSNRQSSLIPETYCYIEKNKDTNYFHLQFINPYVVNSSAYCNTTDKFDESSLISTHDDE